MGRNAQRRRQRRDRAREQLGREIRTTVLERAGSRVRSAIRTITGSGRVDKPTQPSLVNPPPASNHKAVLPLLGVLAWAGPLAKKEAKP